MKCARCQHDSLLHYDTPAGGVECRRGRSTGYICPCPGWQDTGEPPAVTVFAASNKPLTAEPEPDRTRSRAEVALALDIAHTKTPPANWASIH